MISSAYTPLKFNITPEKIAVAKGKLSSKHHFLGYVNFERVFGSPPTQDAIVTIRIMTFLGSGIPIIKPLFATVTGLGDRYPKYTHPRKLT